MKKKDLENEIMSLFEIQNKFENENVNRVFSFLFNGPSLTWSEFVKWCQTEPAERLLYVTYKRYDRNLFINDPKM